MKKCMSEELPVAPRPGAAYCPEHILLARQCSQGPLLTYSYMCVCSEFLYPLYTFRICNIETQIHTLTWTHRGRQFGRVRVQVEYELPS